MANVPAQRKMRELARPVVSTLGSPIQLPDETRNYELKGSHYNMLPSFLGLANEDPLNFIRTFYHTLEHFPLRGLMEDQLRMRCFPHTLKERASTWWMSLPPASMSTWQEVYDKFMGRYYSHSKTTSLRKQISTFEQLDEESFHEAWERFKQLLIDCPHHFFAQELLNQFFYDGLTLTCQYMVDGAAGGTIGNKTATKTYELYEMLGDNSQQKNVRNSRQGSVHQSNAARNYEGWSLEQANMLYSESSWKNNNDQHD